MRATVPEIFGTFLKLGLTSFGGPIAHLGYFHRELIERRKWLDEAQYASLVALCQFLPGPASSKLGFAMGLIRGGWLGALAAFVGFTLPSVLLMLAFASILPAIRHPYGLAVLHGLKLAAVVVVAQGVVIMARRLTPDLPRAVIAVLSCLLLLMISSAIAQVGVIALGAVLGLLLCRDAHAAAPAAFALPLRARTGAMLLAAYAVLLAVALGLASNSPSLSSASAAFYRAGALVFGGGHVVLPLLSETVVAPGWISASDFLAGYGAAQALPGPLFSIAAFLGARIDTGHEPLMGALIALCAIFLPGFLLVSGSLPVWQRLSTWTRALSALAGVNAAVVGLLAAALYTSIWKNAVLGLTDVLIVLAGFVLLTLTRVSVLIALAGCVLSTVLVAVANAPA